MVTNGVESSLVSQVKENQDLTFNYVKANIHKQKLLAFEQGRDGVVKYQGMLCVTRVDGLQERILQEVHSSRYSIHTGSKTMYFNLREVYWCECMNKDII